MSPARRRRFRWLALLLILLLLVGGAVFFWPRERRLLDRATPVADARHWGHDEVPDYQWLSPDEILYARYPADNLDAKQKPIPTMLRHSITKKRETEEPLLTRYIRDSESLIKWTVSPDGRSVFWQESYPEASACVFDLKTQAIHRSKTDYVQQTPWAADWAADSRHWYLLNGRTLTFLEADLPQNRRTLNIRQQRALLHKRILSMLPERALLEISDKDDELHVVEIEPGKKGPSRDRFTAKASEGGTLESPVLSPKADKLAWVMKREFVPPLARWLSRLFPSRTLEKQFQLSVWVGNLATGEKREVGSLTMPQSKAGDEDALMPYDLRWVPDNRRLSFLYGDTLYTVPAD